MQVTVEKVSNVERRLTIVIPVNQVEEAYDKQLNKFAQKAKIKGFREGKAPMNVVKQHYGDEARKEALSEVINESLYKALHEQKIQPVNMPRVEPKIMEPNKPLEYVATVEVLPEIGEVKFNLQELEKPVVGVTEDDVNRVLEQLRKQYTKWKVVDREARLQDRVMMDYNAEFEGNTDKDSKVENFPIELGSKLMLPGFEDGLLGVKAGDVKTLNLSFPADFHIADKAGKPITFTVTIKKIYEADMPAIDEAFMLQLGVKSGKEEELRKQIRDSLEMECKRLVTDKVKDQLFRHLLEENNLEVPASLVAREAKNIHDEMYPQHEHHDHHQHSDDEMTAFNDIAKKTSGVGAVNRGVF